MGRFSGSPLSQRGLGEIGTAPSPQQAVENPPQSPFDKVSYKE